MTHPRIDECSIPMATHAAEVRRTRATVLHRYRPTEDPAGAPSGMRWRCLGDCWELSRPYLGRSRIVLGWVYRDGRGVFGETTSGNFTAQGGTLADCSRSLVDEVRRG